MRKFKGIIMSMYTSKLTILHHFLKTLSMIHMPPKLIASAGSDTSVIFMYEMNISDKNINPNSSILFHFLKKIFDKIYMPLKPQAINHRACTSYHS